jgi:hypothetical protein
LIVKIRVLAKVEAVSGGWIGNAYGGDGIIAIGAAPTEEDLVTTLRANVEDYLATHAAAWLQRWQHAGTAKFPNCPEGAIKLPIDLWVCKLVGETCPIQAQVFLDDPQQFFAGCLASEGRKQEIFDAVATGRYAGFHHTTGRYLCVRCADERGRETTFSYHYPWELASLDDFAAFDVERDMGEIVRKLIRAGVARSAVLNALCARHSLEIAHLLYPDVAAKLRVLEFDIARPRR